jgi:hypothetical protein
VLATAESTNPIETSSRVIAAEERTRRDEPHWRPRLAHLATPEFIAALCALGFVGPG